MLSLDEANRVAFNYLTFEVNRYVLNLKREQALGLGISNEFYDKMQKDVRETNQFLNAYILQWMFRLMPQTSNSMFIPIP